MNRRASALAVFVSLAVPAAAQDYNRPDIVRSSCQKDGCNEFSIANSQRMAEGPDGVLVRARIRTYKASYQGRKEVGDEDGVVYCSRRRPALLSGAGGPVRAYYLAPLNPAEYKERIDMYALYFAVCDSLETARAVTREHEGVARRLGYSVDLDTAQPVTLAHAEDILQGRPERNPGEEPLLPPGRVGPDRYSAREEPDLPPRPRTERRGLGPDDFVPPVIRRLWE